MQGLIILMFLGYVVVFFMGFIIGKLFGCKDTYYIEVPKKRKFWLFFNKEM